MQKEMILFRGKHSNDNDCLMQRANGQGQTLADRHKSGLEMECTTAVGPENRRKLNFIIEHNLLMP